MTDSEAEVCPSLNGVPIDLAFLLADVDEASLCLGSSIGSHRLFVAAVDGGILASSQVRPLALALGSDLRVDRSYEDFLLGFGFFPDNQTPYVGIRSLAPGSIWSWNEGSGLSPRNSQRKRFSKTEIRQPSTIPAAQEQLYDTFFEILTDQAGSRRSHAVLLGGFDSALVVAGLRRMGHEVDTYTFAFGDERYEQRHASEISSLLGAQHHWVRFTPEIIGHGLDRFDEIFNQPSAQPHYQLHTAHASRIIAEHGHQHVFSGDGCDSAFLGYPTVSQRARVVQWMGRLPPVVRRAALAGFSLDATERHLGHVARMARSTLRSLELASPARGHLPTQYLDDVALNRLRKDTHLPQAESVNDIRSRLAEDLADLPAIALAFHGNGLTGQSGAKVEGAVAVSGIAHLSPYRDARMAGLARSFPIEFLRSSRSPAGSSGKDVLLRMAEGYDLLPRFVIDMPKQSPTDSPIDEWYTGPLRGLVLGLLDGLPFDYDRNYIEEILSPKWPEDVYRNRVSLSHHAFQAIGLLCSYAAFTRRASADDGQ